jgi:hypothetical protein
MERRRDVLLRGVVDQVHPPLTAAGFGITDRGSHPEVHWVEYRTAAVANQPRTVAARLVLSHFLDRPSVAASLRWYRGASPRTAAVETEAWAYEPGTDRTPDGTVLAAVVAAWISAAVTHGPTRPGAARNGWVTTAE